MWAAILGREHIVRLLLERGAQIYPLRGEGTHTALTAAVEGNNLDIVRLLMAYGARGDEIVIGGPTCLHKAIHRHNLEMAALLLEVGADINRYSYWDTSPARYFCNYFLTPFRKPCPMRILRLPIGF